MRSLPNFLYNSYWKFLYELNETSRALITLWIFYRKRLTIKRAG